MRKPVSAHPTCPSCDIGLREFIINENYLVCPCCETLFRKSDESISPKEACIRESYRERAITILNSDKTHYENLYCDPFIVEKFSIPLLDRDWILSIGGGHPKLESYLKPKRIDICDLFPEVYMQSMDDFRRLYNYDGVIQYHRVKIDGAFTPPVPEATQNGLITFVHFLEHLEYDQAIQVLKNLPRHTDVVIYGPNSEKKPMGREWIHMRPKDHLTLIPLKRFRQILSAMKYEIRYDTPYSDDMLILFNTAQG
jgi:hypothetical protein